MFYTPSRIMNVWLGDQGVARRNKTIRKIMFRKP